MTYGSVTPAETDDIRAARAEAQTDPGANPAIQFSAARRKRSIRNSLANPFGANVSPETLEAMRYAREAEVDQDAGQAMKEDYFNRKQARFQKLYAMAGLTQPRIVQTGGTSTGTVSQPFNWGGLISGGLSAAAGAI